MLPHLLKLVIAVDGTRESWQPHSMKIGIAVARARRFATAFIKSRNCGRRDKRILSTAFDEKCICGSKSKK